jgi:hypothetical protein
MRGDFSKLTFRPDKGYSAVLTQQGRVQLDADINEQVAIQAYLERRLAADLIGRHAGPVGGDPATKGNITAFGVSYNDQGTVPDLTIGAGRYYVDGIMTSATKPVPLDPVPSGSSGSSVSGAQASDWTYWTQPYAYLDQTNDADRLPTKLPFLVYLKVYERFITAVEDPDILETALGTTLPDTCGRVKVIWQVLPIRDGDGFQQPNEINAYNLRVAFDAWADARNEPAAWLAAQTAPPQAQDDPCIIAPDAQYRGPENQLYRVEVHRAGTTGTDPQNSATFKWSRDNGSVIFPVSTIEGTWVTLAALGRDDKMDLNVQDWVEVVDDAYLAHGSTDPLLQVAEVDVAGRRVRLSAEPDPAVGRIAARHPYLRRWDQQAPTGSGAPQLWDGALQITEGAWVDLEDGVQVWFKSGGTYRTGDYWLIPARTLTGDVEWPRDANQTPLLSPPAGVAYHYAPLAWIFGGGQAIDLREQFKTLAEQVP